MKKELIQLVSRAQAGDEEAFQCIYQEFYNQAYATAFKYCKNDADAKDAVQDAFITIHRALPTLKNPNLFDFWMTRIIYTKCLNIFRKNKIVYMEDEQLQKIPNKNEVYKEYIPHEKIAEEEEKKLMKKFVHKLTPGQQDCIQLFYFEQMSLKEVAQSLNISIGTTKSRLFSARKSLKRYIEEYEGIQDVKVSFKSSASMGVVAVACFKKYLLKFNMMKDQLTTNSAAMNSVVVMNIAAVTLTASIILYGGTQAYKVIANELTQKEIASNSFDSEDSMLTLTSYPAVTYKEKAYTSPKSMYYALIPWIAKADKPTIEEVNTMKKMYEVIKAENGIYWKKMVDGKWSEKFEKL